MSLTQLEREFNALFAGTKRSPKGSPKTKTVAVFPCGYECEVENRRRHGGGFRVMDPDGGSHETSLTDLKFFLEQDYPGVKFERRAI